MQRCYWKRWRTLQEQKRNLPWSDRLVITWILSSSSAAMTKTLVQSPTGSVLSGHTCPGDTGAQREIRDAGSIRATLGTILVIILRIKSESADYTWFQTNCHLYNKLSVDGFMKHVSCYTSSLLCEDVTLISICHSWFLVTLPLITYYSWNFGVSLYSKDTEDTNNQARRQTPRDNNKRVCSVGNVTTLISRCFTKRH